MQVRLAVMARSASLPASTRPLLLGANIPLLILDHYSALLDLFLFLRSGKESSAFLILTR